MLWNIWYYHLKWREMLYLSISWYYGSKKILWIQSVLGLLGLFLKNVDFGGPKWHLNSQMYRGGKVTNLGNFPKFYQFFFSKGPISPKVNLELVWTTLRHHSVSYYLAIGWCVNWFSFGEERRKQNSFALRMWFCHFLVRLISRSAEKSKASKNGRKCSRNQK